MIARPGGAQVALGVNMAGNGSDDLVGEQSTQERHNLVLVHIINALRTGGAGHVVQQMPQVVPVSYTHLTLPTNREV